MKVFFGTIICTLLISFILACNEHKTMEVGLHSSHVKTHDSLLIVRQLNLSKKNLLKNYSLSISQAIEASKMAEKLGIPELQYQSYTEVIRGAIFAGLFDVGALYMNKYLDLAELENNEKMIGRATANLGLLHMFLGDLNQADSLFNKGLTLVQHYAKEHHEEVSLEDQINTFLDLGHIYLGKKQIDKAEKFYLKGLSLSRNKMEFQLVSAQLAQSLGILYTQQNQKEKAKAYLDLALSQQKLLNNHSMISSCYMSLGEFSDKFNLEGESLIYFQKGLALAQKSESVELISSISDRLYEIFQKQGNSSLALKYLKMNLDAKAKMKSEQAKESLFRKSFARNIIKNEEAEKLKEKKTKIVLGLFLFFISMIFIHYFRKYWKSNRELKAIQQRNQEKIDKSQEENSKLYEDLAVVNKQMASSALHAIQKEQSLNQIVNRIKSTKSENSDSVHLLKSISKDIEKVNSTKNWEEFEIRFIEIHSHFFPKLLEEHPNLSYNERRLCAFLKLDMSTKEITNLTGQSLRAVELARIRLRKKLNLTNSDTTIFQYLSDF